MKASIINFLQRYMFKKNNHNINYKIEKDEDPRLDYPYPDNPLDNEGYPTKAALAYIRNWGHERNEEGKLIFGKWFLQPKDSEDLLQFIKDIWYYGDDAYKDDENGMFELHTMGWSGNEEVIYELKNTVFWMQKYRAYTTGGHYYFRLKSDCGYDWQVVKKESKW